MIPKIIHYCWFGKNKKPKLVRDCILSWRKFLPNYEIIEWNEDNCIFTNNFAAEAYNQKKWAYVSDFIRLEKLSKYGGIYLDTDMMLLKDLDKLLYNDCFFGYEEGDIISAGIIGATIGNHFVNELLDFYNNFKIDSGTNFHQITIPLVITSYFSETKIDKKSIKIYPETYFYPLPNKFKSDVKNYLNYASEDTYAVHLWNASWVEYDEFYYLRNRKYLKSIFLILKKIIITQKVNLYYFKRIYKNFVESI